MKFDWKGYLQPTPKLMRKIGNTLLGVGLFAMGYSFINDSKYLMGLFFSLGVLGKLMSEFFVEK